MNKDVVVKALKSLKESSKKRNFKQSVDFIANLRNLDLKKPDNQVDFAVSLHYGRGKKVSICAFTGPELKPEAEKVCDETINVDEFDKYAKDKKLSKKLAAKHDFFIAQANIMPKVAAAFGRVFGPRGRMPNPKVGCVVPPKAALKPIYDRLQKTLKITAKTAPCVKCPVGSDDMPEEEVADNIVMVYDQLVHHLPNEKHNIRNIFIKLTMSGTIAFDENCNLMEQKEEPKAEAPKQAPAEKTKPEPAAEKPAPEVKKEEAPAAEEPAPEVKEEVKTEEPKKEQEAEMKVEEKKEEVKEAPKEEIKEEPK